LNIEEGDRNKRRNDEVKPSELRLREQPFSCDDNERNTDA
jgi:hypothetical protein